MGYARLGKLVHATLCPWLVWCQFALSAAAQAPDAAAVLREHAELEAALARSGFGRPLLLQSQLSQGLVQGQVHAVLDAPMIRVQALAHPERWCQVLMLHPNTRSCRSGSTLEVSFGGKQGMPFEAGTLSLRFQAQALADGLVVRLSASKGPLGTHDLALGLQAAALPGGRSVLRFDYGHGYGLLARLAMQTYLSTLGRQKVGFSRETGTDGQPGPLVGGLRGVIERNTMRYFLAIETVLDTLDLPPASWEIRLQRWFDATERHARQLHELERADYLALKRQQLGLP